VNAAAVENLRPARRVLIVEDDDAVAGSLAEVLDDEGYEAAIASNGQQALDWLHDHELPSLILLDLWMPVLTGDEFRQRQLQDAALAQIPVIVISAADDAQSRGRTLGAVAVLTKPIDLDRLLELVERHALP
jgi:CheY-like chemotaxis protein